MGTSYSGLPNSGLEMVRFGNALAFITTSADKIQ
jgi:hypothetical protein